MAGTRALVFAYACDPARGSEPGAGAVLSTVVADICDEVVVLSRLEDHLDPAALGSALGTNVSVVQVGLRSTRLPTYVRYFVWVVLAARAARQLRRDRPFDIVHHLTYGSDWFVNPFVFLKKLRTERWVWGPAGGSSYAPYGVGKKVTHSWALGEWARAVSTRTIRKLVHLSLRHKVDVAIALNQDSERSFTRSKFALVTTQANAVIDYEELPTRAAFDTPLLVYASRGVAWKGLALVLESMQHLPDDWELVVAGSGTDTEAFHELAIPVAERVSFVGTLTRHDSLELLSRASAFALPSLHDSAPWAAAEAAGIGVPVVCLNLGGVSSMAGHQAVVVEPLPTRDLAKRFAESVLTAGEMRCDPFRLHTAEALRSALERSYAIGAPA